jgi:hypothetical protein
LLVLELRMLDSINPERCSERTTLGSDYLRCKCIPQSLGDLILPFALIHHLNSSNIDNKLRLDLRRLEQNAVDVAVSKDCACRSSRKP